MFDIEIWEVYSLNQEVPEHRETPKKIGQISDIIRCDPVDHPKYDAMLLKHISGD